MSSNTENTRRTDRQLKVLEPRREETQILSSFQEFKRILRTTGHFTFSWILPVASYLTGVFVTPYAANLFFNWLEMHPFEVFDLIFMRLISGNLTPDEWLHACRLRLPSAAVYRLLLDG
eukprot:gb/GECH01011031.1/.p1 GENE.gb/GECH01011031.1/~~gb/GECH01011031.1/.p1  ORF type:complete len:119 (+),score=12.62 gb/GECH01011031.1/:1-357(+)